MTDSTLNRFLSSGTNAERLAFTPDPPTPSSGPDPTYIWFETDTGDTYAWDGAAWQQVNTGGGGSGSTEILMPAGRLTLVTATPILTSDQTAKTSVFYTPYRGDTVPIYNGSAWENKTFTELTLTLDTTNHSSGSLYDAFIWNNGGTISIGTGPAWSSSTTRGTGAGTTELQLKNGIWTNKNSITLKNGAGSGTSGIAANTATYVGTIYATANGQTGMAFKPAAASGGTANVLGVYNAYNRARIGAVSREGAASWTYNAAVWRAANNSASNRITFIDGLQQSPIDASYVVSCFGNSTNANVGVNLDSTSSAPNIAPQFSAATSNVLASMSVREPFSPQLGLHYIQAMETGTNATSITFIGLESTPTRYHQALVVQLEM